MDAENRPPDRVPAELVTQTRAAQEKRAAWTLGLIAGSTIAVTILWLRRRVAGRAE